MGILVLGAGGLLGSEIVWRMRARGIQPVACRRSECDATSEDEVVQALQQSRAQIVINCAAYNQVDAAEHHPVEAMRVNRDAAAHIASVAPSMVHFSSDFVFDGRTSRPYTEKDTPHPLSVYGRSKAAGDDAVRSANPRALIVRVGNLYGRAGRNFGSTILARLSRGEQVRADGERRLQPTWAGAVAEQVIALLPPHGPLTHFGLFHAQCQGETTWAHFARELARLSGLNPSLVDAVSTDSFGADAARPAYTVLENHALKQAGLNQMPPWREGLERYLADTLDQAPQREARG